SEAGPETDDSADETATAEVLDEETEVAVEADAGGEAEFVDDEPGDESDETSASVESSEDESGSEEADAADEPEDSEEAEEKS
ncbi:MAG: hypothetical protein O3C69_02590, partial [Chloroflexi bacterium]|nr:hypothetical protein [Chloroflexota bacterium]